MRLDLPVGLPARLGLSEWDEADVSVEGQHDLAGVPLEEVVLQRLQQQPVQFLQAGRDMTSFMELIIIKLPSIYHQSCQVKIFEIAK